jgi:hypothetical protein
VILRNRWVLTVIIKLTVASLGAVVYFMLVAPYLVKVKAVEKAEAEAVRAEEDLDQMRRKQKEFNQHVRRSLPAGPEYKGDPQRTKREYADVAKFEYEQALNKVLRDSGARNTTVNFVDAESNNKTGIPQIDKEFKPTRDSDPSDYLTYTPVVFKVDIPKADLETVAEVLRRYYSLDLLHQITHLTIKPVGGVDLGEDKRNQKDRNDLKVELTTRAIIVHGAERRLSLTPAPMPLAGLGGGLVEFAYENNSRADLRKVMPTPLEPILANSPIREYHYVAAKDVFHGTLPVPPPVITRKPKDDDAPPPPPKPDYREFIWYTTRIHKIDGDEHTLEITVKDKINKEDYELVITQSGEKVVVKSYKFEYENFKIDSAQRRKKVYSQDTLEISKYTMLNKNNFTVYGVDTDGSLILGEKPTGLAPDLPKDDKNQPRQGGGGGVGGGGGRPVGGGGGSRVALPPPDPKAAVIGGMVVTAPKAEKFYRWQADTNLKQIVELSKADAEKAIKRAQTRFLPNAVKDASAKPAPDGDR